MLLLAHLNAASGGCGRIEFELAPLGNGGDLDTGMPEVAGGGSVAGHSEDADPINIGNADAGPGDAGPINVGNANAGPSDADVGNAGARAGDAGPLDATGCDDAHAGALFCSGLELSALSDWSGLTTMLGGVGEWSTSPACRGNGAFRARIATGGARADESKDFAAPISSGAVYVRTYVYISSATPITSEVSPIWLLPLAAPSTGLRFFLTPTNVRTRFTSDFSGGISTITRTYDTPLPTDRWVCLELALEMAQHGWYTLSIDGAEVISTGTVDTRLSSGVNRLAIGITESASDETGADLSFDEVVVDDAPIGCD